MLAARRAADRLLSNFLPSGGLRVLVQGIFMGGMTALAALSTPAMAGAEVSAFPVPGMVTATKGTQISFRGTPLPSLRNLSVTGSRSGRHSGRLRVHSDGLGASFITQRPYLAGETVRVRTRLDVVGTRNGDFSFRVGRRPPLAPTRPGAPSSEGSGEVQRFATRPDLVPPAVSIDTRHEGRAPGFVFLGAKGGRGQDGPMIVDDFGRLVWFRAMRGRELVTDFRVQSYHGKPVLTWWQGRLSGGYGRGEGVIYSDQYRAIRRVRMANGLHADLHEFEITPQDTALLIGYDTVSRPEGRVVGAVVQEVEIDTGLVRFEWHSIGQIGTSESFRPRPEGRGAWDYLHLNSIALDRDGNFIVSARQTNAVYKLSRKTGHVVWRLGGRRSDFRLGPGAQFALQHDARPQPDGSITIYDNSASPPVRKRSRAIRLALDEERRVATLRRALTHPDGLLSSTQGSAQALIGGNTFVGWGSQRYFSEYDASGQLVFDGHLSPGNDSYRAYRFTWVGRPHTLPKLAATRSGLRVSWNGATNVVAWQVLAGRSPSRLVPVATVPFAGFETALPAQTARYVAVRALDASGAVLGTSRPVRP